MPFSREYRVLFDSFVVFVTKRTGKPASLNLNVQSNTTVREEALIDYLFSALTAEGVGVLSTCRVPLKSSSTPDTLPRHLLILDTMVIISVWDILLRLDEVLIVTCIVGACKTLWSHSSKSDNISATHCAYN